MTRLSTVEAASTVRYQERLDVLGVVLKMHVGNGLANEAAPYDVEVLLTGIGIQKSVDVVIVRAISH
jgi:hypothetical protein